MNINHRIELLRGAMKDNGIDAFIVPSSDNHLSEYVGEHFKCRQWISGFTGSAGTVVVTMDEAHLWVDGRYHIQAERQVKGSSFVVEKMGIPGVKKYTEWIGDKLQSGDTIGFNGKVMPVDALKDFEAIAQNKALKTKLVEDLFEKLWKDRPQLPKEEVFVHEVKFSGKSTLEKLREVREKMVSEGATHYLIASLVDIAWLLNLRGNDVPNNPVFLSYLLMDMNSCTLYVDKSKLSRAALEQLDSSAVKIKDYEEVTQDLALLGEEAVILYDSSKTNLWLKEAIKPQVKCIERRDITTELKAIKNAVELKNLENCQVKDGVAMVKFLYWLKTNLRKIEITELSAADKLEQLRREQEHCLGISFDTISAYGANAAMMHYKATEENCAVLEPRGFYLLDSGGQYLDGTTDITRTYALGELTQEEKEDYTLVLKGHIALNKAIFLYGATGSNLDVIARKPMWDRGLDYKCGTGHGVGFLLSVHEGPQGFSQVPNTVKLTEGMIITNEPGIYKEGRHGIRTENTMLVVPYMETEFGKFMKFDVISYCPIDLEPIVVEMLTEEERQWLNDYHKLVYNKLSGNLNEEERSYLAFATRSI